MAFRCAAAAMSGSRVLKAADTSSSIEQLPEVDPKCRYKVQYYVDSWMGYIADRNRFLAAIANATNPVVYGGDTHNYWGG